MTWQTNAFGEVSTRTNKYTELATGLNYQENGEWKESKAEIEILDNGNGAIATQGGHKVSFTPNLDANGGVDMQMPDGRHLRSQILGLGYYDRVSGESEIIAVVKDVDGELHGSNVVVYPDAFTGVDADVRFTYRISGFEQDVILRSQPPPPQKFGLNPTNTHLEVFTEFVNPPTPVKTVSAIPGTTLTDEKLNFGRMVMGRGRAFPLVNGQVRKQGVATGKLWITVDGRTVLVEGVEYKAVEKDLKALPEMPKTSSLLPKSKNSMLAEGRKIPGRSIAKKTMKSKPMMLASAPQKKDGFVLDYISTVTSGTDFTFVAGETYLISDWLTFSGTTTIQGGAVLKFSQNATLDIGGTLVCPSGLGNNACLTSTFDESYGDQIPSEDPAYSLTGPNLMLSLNSWSGTIMLKNLTLRFGGVGVQSGGGSGIEAWHCQFDHFLYCGLSGDYVKLRNVRFNDIGNPDGDYAIEPYYSLDAQHVTVNKCRKVWGQMPETVALTNCLFTSSGNVSLDSDEYTQIKRQAVAVVPNPPSCPYYDPQWLLMLNNPAWWGYYSAYLVTNSPYRNIGSTAIDSVLLADIKKLTTYWPGQAPAYAPVDTGLPDLGFHYPSGVSAANALDTDGDGMVDVYEDVNHNGIYDSGDRSDWQSADTDGDGTDDRAEHLAGTDPNELEFISYATNSYVSTATTAVKLVVQNGKAFRMAVLVDDTNTASATWTSFNTNVSVNLGTTEGWHKVLIGIRGASNNTQQVWLGRRFNLDTTPPYIVVTNPAVLTTSQSLIQIQGYVNESLNTARYDLSNSLGVITNRYALVGGTFYDTNKHEFTTNYFQCYDVDFTNGINLVTFRFQDRAGNETVTNMTITLTNDTDSPIVALIWPRDGEEVSGDLINIKGTLDDISATISATITQTNGATQTVEGLIERDGKFWLEHVSIGGGTNHVVISCKDPWGNTTTTNISLFRSPVSLGMNPVPESQLWQNQVNVTGMISDSTYRVFVNGVEAVVGGDGQWTATGVPVTLGGMATFKLRGYAPNEQIPVGGGN